MWCRDVLSSLDCFMASPLLKNQLDLIPDSRAVSAGWCHVDRSVCRCWPRLWPRRCDSSSWYGDGGWIGAFSSCSGVARHLLDLFVASCLASTGQEGAGRGRRREFESLGSPVPESL